MIHVISGVEFNTSLSKHYHWRTIYHLENVMNLTVADLLRVQARAS